MREQTIMNQITGIIAGFDFSVPLHHYLKNYFRQHKQLGSRDRKIISSGCFSYYRCAKLFNRCSEEERLAYSFYLTGEKNLLSEYLFNKYSLTEKLLINERLAALQKSTSVLSFDDAFPFIRHLSEGIDANAFAESLFQQPYVWIRIRHGYEKRVADELLDSEITPVVTHKNASGFLPITSLTSLSSYLEGYFEIQDFSSQETLTLLPEKIMGNWWDCCSGSGGKTLTIANRFPEVNFLLTDNRVSVLENAQIRLRKAQVKNYKIQQLDLKKTPSFNNIFDGIVADVPCSGSGTWSRSPENMWNFDESKIDDFAKLQLNIIKKVIPFLKVDGLLLYITCSAFAGENELNAKLLSSDCNLTLIQQKVFHGYSHHADTMFGCLFRKNQ